jgi:heme/copper-type cytochrome/quinol oxidase subunit 1
MTVTEAPRDVAESDPAAGGPPAVVTEDRPAGLAALVGSGDPATVGKLFVGTSLLFLLVSGVAGVLVGFEQVDTARFEVIGSGGFGQVVTLHSVTGAFLVVLPLLLGLATAVVPLQIGASTVAFPRATAVSYWTWLVASGLLLAAYAADGGPFGGDQEAVALFVAALIAVLAALCVTTVSILTTIVSLRTPGMSLRRMPLFSWSMLVAGSVWLLTLPILAGVLLLAYVDVTYGQQFLGGADGIYDRIRWVLWQPTLYVFAVPALGIIADVVPVFAQRRHKRHRVAMALIGSFGVLSFGAWTQLGTGVDGEAADPTPWLDEGVWTAVSFLVLLPMLGLLGLWTGTLLAGRPRLVGPLLCSLVAGALLLLGLAAGAATAVEGLDLVGTTWMTGQAYAVLIATLVAAFGGLAYWAPKLYGGLVPEAVTRLVAPLLLVGAAVVAVAYAVGGLLDQPQWVLGDLSGNSDESTIEALNLVAAIGGIVVVLASLLLILGVVRAWRASAEAMDDDPWSGHTLEWATSSPPPIGNFATLPEVTSEAPVYDARYRAELAGKEAS